MARFLFLVTVLCLALVGCGGKSIAGKYYINVQKTDLMPGADKIILDLKDDNTYSVDAGPMNLVSGTWKQIDGKVTFSQGQGLIVQEYVVSGNKLLPQVGGQPVPGWDFTRK